MCLGGANSPASIDAFTKTGTLWVARARPAPKIALEPLLAELVNAPAVTATEATEGASGEVDAPSASLVAPLAGSADEG